MELEGQGARRHAAENGYAMAALLVSLAVMSVLMSIAMPVWRHQTQREREAELVFRGEQYARAIALYQRKFPGALPASVDLLVQQKFLRKKYKDPMTEDGQFQILYAGARPSGAQQGGAAGARTVGQAGDSGSGRLGGARATGGGPGAGMSQGMMGQGTAAMGQGMDQGGGQVSGVRAGIIGVTSKSTEASIMLYKGRGHYNEWQFTFNPMMARPGGGVPGAGPGVVPTIDPRTGRPVMPGMMPPGGRGPGGQGPGDRRFGPGQAPPDRPPFGRGGPGGTPRPPGRPPG